MPYSEPVTTQQQKRVWTVRNHEVERHGVLVGGAVSLALTLSLGVLLGTLVAEGSAAALGISAAIFGGVLVGGCVAGYRSRANHLLAGTLSAVAPAALALVVQFIRLANDDNPVPVTGLVLLCLLLLSIGTLGGLLGGWRSPRKRSLRH